MDKFIPTHKVSFWGIRCYFDETTNALWGVNWFADALIGPAVSLHNFFASITPGCEAVFPLKVIEKYSDRGVL